MRGREQVLEAMQRARRPLEMSEIVRLSRVSERDVEQVLRALERERIIRTASRNRWELR